MTNPTDLILKHPGNPILTKEDVPYPCANAYNCGACKADGRYALLFRVDRRWEEGPPEKPRKRAECKIGLAWSDDGIHFTAEPHPVLTANEEEFDRVYDPRVTRVDDQYYMCYATETPWGIHSGMAVSKDLKKWERVYVSEPDNRNAVIFPERIDGKLVRLDRPFARKYAASRPYDMWLSVSPDGVHWGGHKLVLAAADNPWSNDKIGPGTPPIRTEHGWLALYHGVSLDDNRPGCGWEGNWKKLYEAAPILLDLEQPHKIIGIGKKPALVPDQVYERPEGGGMRPNVVFPGGLIAEPDGTCKIYWGAADTVVAVGTAKIQDLVDVCLQDGPPSK
ncbi:MAG: glycoside hydrolase family 130 protein [Kiritimatiellae bacterium]|nr:glycoside hydrolase family 130 protein [Kiritimatiellia bacterium]